MRVAVLRRRRRRVGAAAITPSQLVAVPYQKVVVGEAFSYSFAPLFANADSYALAPASPALPLGLTIAPNGDLAGTATVAGMNQAPVIRATNAASGLFVDVTLDLSVAQRPGNMPAPTLTELTPSSFRVTKSTPPANTPAITRVDLLYGPTLPLDPISGIELIDAYPGAATTVDIALGSTGNTRHVALKALAPWGDGTFLEAADYSPNTATIALSTGNAAPTGQNQTLNFVVTAGAADTTAPVLSSPGAVKTGSATATATVTTDEGNGTARVVITTAATAPSAAQIRAGQDHLGAAAAASGAQTVTAAVELSFSITGLTPATTYYAHFLQDDLASNQSNIVTSTSFITDAALSGVSYLGQVSQVHNRLSSGDTVDITSLGLQTGDLVVVAFSSANVTDRALSITTSGYTQVAKLRGNSTQDTNLLVSIKLMGATPDTNVVVSGTGATNEPGTVVVRAYRGVDQTTPQDVAAVTTTAVNGTAVNPGSITPVTPGSMIVVCGAAAAAFGATTAAFSSSDLTDFSSNYNSWNSLDTIWGIGNLSWTSGAFDGAVWTGPGSTTGNSLAAVVLALRAA